MVFFEGGVPMMKKLLSVLLCVVVLLTTVAFCISAEEEETFSAIVTSDIHYLPMPGTVPNLYPGEKYYTASDGNNLLTESRAIVKQWLRQAEEREEPFVLISGDLVDSGYISDHQQLIALLKNFKARTGKRIYVINGNHDFNAGISVSRFRDLYKDFGYSEALTTDERTCSYTAELVGKYRLIAIDSCNHIDGNDGITQELLDWVDAQVKTAKKDGKELVAMMHHNFIEHLKLQSFLMQKYIIRDEWNMKERFLDWGIRYVFTGHQHGQDIASYTDKKNRVVYDVMSTALTAFPCAFRTADLSSAGMQVHTYTIDSLKLSELPKGYSQELLDEIQNDLNTYARGVFKTQFGGRIDAFVSPYAFREIFGKIAGGRFNSVLEAHMPAFFSYLNMPLYKENAKEGEKSLEDLANSLHLSFPKTDKELSSVYDILYEVVASYYAGDENIPYTDDLVVLGVRALYTILYSTLRDVSKQVQKEMLSDLKANFKADLLPFSVATIGKIALSGAKNEHILQMAIVLASPFIEMYGSDMTVPDNDAFLPAVVQQQKVSFAESLQNFFHTLAERLSRYFLGWKFILLLHA